MKLFKNTTDFIFKTEVSILTVMKPYLVVPKVQQIKRICNQLMPVLCLVFVQTVLYSKQIHQIDRNC